MPNPRYYQDEPAKKEKRLAQYAQFQEGQQRQQALDQRSQAGMMEQLQQMYGLQQQQQIDPLRMQALRASTEAQGLQNEQQRFQNQWAQPNAEAADALVRAQIEALGREKQKTLPHGFEYLPPDAQTAALDEMYPQLKVQRAQKAQQENDAQWQEIETQARQHGVKPDEQNNIMNQFGPENLAYLQSLFTPTPQPQTRGQVYGEAFGAALKDKYLKLQDIFVPVRPALNWLNSPYKP